jgi:TonB family protein
MPTVQPIGLYFRRRSPLEWGLAVSVLLHGSLWLSFAWTHHLRLVEEAVDPLEVDLSRPFRITSDPRLAHRTEHPGAGAPLVQNPTPIPGKGVVGGSETPAPGAQGPAKEWVLPTPETKKLEPPSDGEAAGRPEAQGQGPGLGGLGGVGDGEVDWVYLTDLPRLLNRERLLRDVRKYYPEVERRAGREGRVALDVHINAVGRVTGVTVVESAGDLFDEAARKVLSQARFSPARVKDRAVAVKIRQAIDFRLE